MFLCAILLVTAATATTTATAATATATLGLKIHTASSTPLATTSPSFLGVNIDAASLYQQARLDFNDADLRAIGAALGAEGPGAQHPMTLRVGGSAADDLGWSSNTSKTNKTIVLDAAYWDEMNQFVGHSGFNLAFDLNGMTSRRNVSTHTRHTSNTPSIANVGAAEVVAAAAGEQVASSGRTEWDPTDATGLLQHVREAGQRVWALQLGNEPGHWQTRHGGEPTPEEHG